MLLQSSRGPINITTQVLLLIYRFGIIVHQRRCCGCCNFKLPWDYFDTVTDCVDKGNSVMNDVS